jgi:hypothetical protein
MKPARALSALLAGLALLALATPSAWIQADTPDKAPAEATRADRGDPFGYSAFFDAQLEKIGQVSPDDFARRYPSRAEYLPKLTWDPTTAKFWDKFQMDPNAPGARVRVRGPRARLFAEMERARARAAGKPEPKGPPTREAKGLHDFRLDKDELALFKRNGFVVSERLGAPSCTEMLYRIYVRDLPVFISADAVLHAWHRTFDVMLEEIETHCLAPTLDQLLADMAGQVPALHARHGKGPLGDSVRDADFFLAVARSLLVGQPVRSRLGQDRRVARTLDAVGREGLEEFVLFGRERKVDFSQFKPRGHYENSEALKRYFKAMMWCGRIDLRVAGNPDYASPREMGAAVVLHDLLHASGGFERWQGFDRMITAFVGRPDSMTFADLTALLKKAGVRGCGDVKSLDTLKALQKKIQDGKLGLQHIRGHHFYSPIYSSVKVELPRSFTVLGQRFTLDSWVTSKVVFDDVLWNDKKVQRRIPSCLDVAFAALHNDHVVPDLVARINDPAGRRFRDGLTYQHNLAAVRDVIDAQKESVWRETIYNNWLACLRELSVPTTADKYPEAMRTRQWAMKTVNTQMASWAQLRHDTILYVKQSYTAGVSCFYPAGYVEPVPHFWARLEQMAVRSAELIEKTPYPDHDVAQPGGGTYRAQGKVIQTSHAKFLRNFAKTVGTLKGIAEKHLAQKELSKEEVKFLENTVEMQMGCGGPRRYSGWYPGLFYGGPDNTTKWDALVSDVHTDVPAPLVGDPGCVLHQGVGNVDLLVVAIDNGKDRMVYAGPVLSHYEFEMPGVTRKADSEWKKDLKAGKGPPRPAWTRGYLVPGLNKEAKGYK